MIPRQAHRVQPELRRAIVPVNVNVRRLVRLVAVELEPVGTDAQHDRHSQFYLATPHSVPARAFHTMIILIPD